MMKVQHPCRLDKKKALDDSDPGYQVSTILDLTESEPIVVRRGLGWEAAAAWEKD
jgi:tRNA A37 threonylcarbamoyladenosine synthetase subunit TsaC/SUA5/YrdC